jgi:hypothetical protein
VEVADAGEALEVVPDVVPDAAVLINVPVPDSPTLPPLLFVGLGVMGVGGLVYGGLMKRGQDAHKRYTRGFVIDRCPVCGQGKLRMEVVARRRLGIPVVTRRAVHCDVCHSVLREVAPRRWKYRISAQANPALHARFNEKVLDEGTLKML